MIEEPLGNLQDIPVSVNVRRYSPKESGA